MVFVYIFAIIWGILQIVLFFKIWGMTNDVEKIVGILETYNTNKSLKNNVQNSKVNVLRANETQDVVSQFTVGDLVVDGDEIQWRVVEINGGLVVCKNSTKGIAEFSIDDLKLFGR